MQTSPYDECNIPNFTCRICEDYNGPWVYFHEIFGVFCEKCREKYYNKLFKIAQERIDTEIEKKKRGKNMQTSHEKFDPNLAITTDGNVVNLSSENLKFHEIKWMAWELYKDMLMDQVKKEKIACFKVYNNAWQAAEAFYKFAKKKEEEMLK